MLQNQLEHKEKGKKMDTLFKMFGLTRVFDKDDSNDDTNNSDASGGDDKNKGGGGGGDDSNKQKPAEDQTHTLKIDGVYRQVTTKELVDLAQKAGGAEKRFEDANTLKTKAEDGLRIQDLMGRLSDGSTPSEGDIKELAALIGVDASEFASYLQEEPAPTGNTTAAIDSEALAKALGMKVEDLVKTGGNLDRSFQGQVSDARQQIRNKCDNMVDKDEIFGKIKIGKGGNDVIDTIKEMVAEDVFRKIQDGEAFGTDLTAASIQKVRAYLVKMGIPGKPDEHPLTLGLIPGGGLPSEVTSDSPIQRVSAGEEGAEDNFVKRAMQKGLKMIRENAAKN